MAEFVVKIADERGHLLEQIENGYSEAEVRWSTGSSRGVCSPAD
jgi:hypothetical protein